MYNIKLVNSCDCLRSVHCQISVTISKSKVIFPTPLSFLLSSLSSILNLYIYTMYIGHTHSHFPISSSTLPQNLSCLCFGLMRLATAFCPGSLFSETSADSHSCELVKGGVIASLENGFSQPFTPSYSSYILPAPSFTMWAYEEMARFIE